VRTSVPNRTTRPRVSPPPPWCAPGVHQQFRCARCSSTPAAPPNRTQQCTWSRPPALYWWERLRLQRSSRSALHCGGGLPTVSPCLKPAPRARARSHSRASGAPSSSVRRVPARPPCARSREAPRELFFISANSNRRSRDAGAQPSGSSFRVRHKAERVCAAVQGAVIRPHAVPPSRSHSPASLTRARARPPAVVVVVAAIFGAILGRVEDWGSKVRARAVTGELERRACTVGSPPAGAGAARALRARL
jgi:hypothetical protein